MTTRHCVDVIMTRVVFYLLMLFVGIVTIHGQTEYRDAPVTTSSTCSVDCCTGCLKETITPTSQILSKCTTKTQPQSYMAPCGYLGISRCTRSKVVPYKYCVNVNVTYNKISVTCKSGCTCHSGNVFSSAVLK